MRVLETWAPSWCLLFDLKGWKRIKRGETFLVGELTLFRGWRAMKHLTSSKAPWIYARTWHTLVGPAPPCANYYVPVEGLHGPKESRGFWMTSPCSPLGNAMGSTMASPLSPATCHRHLSTDWSVPSGASAESAGLPKGVDPPPALPLCNSQQGTSHWSDAPASSWIL